MTEEFNLSEKIIPFCWIEDLDENGCKTMKADALYEDETIEAKDVKEFIRLLKEEVSNVENAKDSIIRLELMYKLNSKIDKLAGEKLI